LLRQSVGEVVDMLFEPGGRLPYANRAVLERLLGTLITGAEDARIGGLTGGELLSRAPLAEAVPELIALLGEDKSP
jgi:hypothetical protein